MGNKSDMEQAIKLLEEVKESIINAYEEKTHLSRNKIAKMMDDETWLNAKKALNLGFVDGILFTDKKKYDPPDEEEELDRDTIEDMTAMSYSAVASMDSLVKKLSDIYKPVKGTSIDQLDKRLSLLK